MSFQNLKTRRLHIRIQISNLKYRKLDRTGPSLPTWPQEGLPSSDEAYAVQFATVPTTLYCFPKIEIELKLKFSLKLSLYVVFLLTEALLLNYANFLSLTGM